jgi:hypothetical protein
MEMQIYVVFIPKYGGGRFLANFGMLMVGMAAAT